MADAQVVPLSPHELKEKLDAGEQLVLLDVREPEEIALCRLPGTVVVPLGELSLRHIELDPDLPTVVVCHHGIRSAHAATALAALGFDELYNLTGGIDRWARDIEPTMLRY